jgi:hypothetical protein
MPTRVVEGGVPITDAADSTAIIGLLAMHTQAWCSSHQS